MRAMQWTAVLTVGAVAMGLAGSTGPASATEWAHIPRTAVAAPTATAKAKPKATAKARITIRAPRGVPATVVIAGATRRVAAKPAKGTVKATTVTLAAGRYRVQPQPVVSKGRLFVGPTVAVVVRSKGVSRATVRYRAAKSATRLHTTGITRDSIRLAWSGPAAATYLVRRAVGGSPPRTRRSGVLVTTKKRTALDKGLSPGTQYSYSLFSRIKGQWSGPLSAIAGTAAPQRTLTASYVAAPTTLIATRGDILRVETTGAGVRVTLAARSKVPVLGAAVTLPRSKALPGGYLGKVTSISPDGRVLALVAAGLADAFDFYSIDVDDFSGPPAAGIAQAGPVRPLTATPRNRRGRTGRVAGTAVLANCLGGSAGKQISYSPSFQLGGHFEGTINKYKVGWVDVPYGASFDAALTATVTGAMAVQVNAALKCGIPFTPVLTPIATTPVPISFYFTPVAEVAVGGALEMSNIGMTATAGVQFSGSFSLAGAPSFSGGPILTAGPLKPVVTANGTVGLTVGGEVIVGPGAGTPAAGVIAGVGGKMNPLDATFGPLYTSADQRHNLCLKAEAAFTRELNLSAKAWLGSWDISKSVTIDALKGSSAYGGSPWYLPADCDQIPPGPDPGQDVLGDGVQPVEEATTGSADQWGRLDGFAAGQTTWVLSTGRIVDAVGAPSTFASTDMSQPGSSMLSGLIGGLQTFDAASYKVKLIPQGDVLHVKYVFASEEYPEYVGSQFNDVMGVLVNGANCANVPGTSQPVSVNSINAGQNADYYVDNSTGAAGYSTSMDGLTQPLTCDVPVTPGTPVTVEIGVADTSDGVYDSAVALLDQGIWAD